MVAALSLLRRFDAGLHALSRILTNGKPQAHCLNLALRSIHQNPGHLENAWLLVVAHFSDLQKWGGLPKIRQSPFSENLTRLARWGLKLVAKHFIHHKVPIGTDIAFTKVKRGLISDCEKTPEPRGPNTPTSGRYFLEVPWGFCRGVLRPLRTPLRLFRPRQESGPGLTCAQIARLIQAPADRCLRCQAHQ